MEEIFKDIITFIRQLYSINGEFVPLHAPVFKGNEKKYLDDCIDSTFVSSVGKFVDLFEEKAAIYTGAKKAVACVNGTSALHLALQLVGVERDTEVITQPLTFIATANAIRYCGAHPVFLDVDSDTMGLSPLALHTWLRENTEQRAPVMTQDHTIPQNQTINIKTGKRISACVPMHTFGHPCRIDEIVNICNSYNIPVVEDAAESMGSFYKNQHTGTFGRIGVLSYNGNKVITTGGGGMLLFNDLALGLKAKHLSTQAKVAHPWDFNHDEIGYNYRMPNINAALGLAQMEQLPEFIKSKRKTAEAYKLFFETLNTSRYIRQSNDTLALKQNKIQYVQEPSDSISNYWLNCILLPTIEQRDAFLKYSNQNGIMSRPAWKLMNELDIYQSCETDTLTNARDIANRLVNLPSSIIIS
jgi:aminotransferase in exopolysaccharide biosynthesis